MFELFDSFSEWIEAISSSIDNINENVYNDMENFLMFIDWFQKETTYFHIYAVISSIIIIAIFVMLLISIKKQIKIQKDINISNEKIDNLIAILNQDNEK